MSYFPNDDPDFEREVSRIASLTATEIWDLGRVAERLLPDRFSIRLRAMAERQADAAGGLARLWAGEAAFAARFLRREVELKIDFDAATGEDRTTLEAAYRAAQRAGLATAAGSLIDESLKTLLATPWSIVVRGEVVEDLV